MKFKTILLLLALCVAAGVSAQNNEDIVDRVSRAVGVRLPDGYEAKVKEFAMKSRVLEGSGGEFTEQWIAGQMKTSWGIDRGNQLLFVWDAVYEQITKKNFYDGEDGNKARLDEFEKVMDNVEACGKKFKEEYTAHMKQSSISQTYRGLKQCIEYYQLCKKYPSQVKPNELAETKEYAKYVTNNCKKYNIDYKAVLRKGLGNDKKVEELLKFYGVE